ncbi:polysaccharide deacetylase [Burkholderia cepacia]|uniref:polysaccharide deacetylase family protein n=1 Tax=Burkholderia cepacia TaxID=292 RepID=UPI00075EE9B3|nr:polysaccharide deacetylase family protein [Burkholderia cepacia]KVH74193.1 polysaccharide deacetylase [Burkholderia cepacia]KWC67936.1 polysaccharide deacetylase [Burkholderia cepacia]MDN7859674.1 polysaccharide deacetylase family protein [Burkholderia cepacia]MDN7898796.1 polysaccharide deacetylase family protein [Burkholderia cepacia]NTX46191.1 polysaccharide deacetylase family protein [Burkholderia cepacia]
MAIQVDQTDRDSVNQAPDQPTRRSFLTKAGVGAGAFAVGAMLQTAQVDAQTSHSQSNAAAAPGRGEFWPDGARLVISISMQFEAGGQPPKGADNPFPKVDFPASVPADLAAEAWFAYGYREGIPRMLDLWDRHDVKVTAHMIGEAAKRHPEIAREIVARGHEASGHGPTWNSQYAMSRPQEREFLIQARSMVEEVTGQRPIGYNANWLRRGPNTLSLLQELGYVYHIDDTSRDEPFIEKVNGKDFVVVPYTLRNNDILLVEGRNYSPEKFLEQIKFDFDQLYEEAGSRRRMMSISAHDRISGTPQMTRAWDAFLRYAKSHPGVAFMRKDDIARFVLKSPITVRESETI